MIKKYILKDRSIEIFSTLNQSHSFKLPAEYSYFFCVLQFEDFLLVSMFYSKKSTPDEKKRRNVWRISENATVSWVIETPYDYWIKKTPNDKYKQKAYKKTCFSRIYKSNNKIVAINCGASYLLNPETGKIKFWKPAERF